MGRFLVLLLVAAGVAAAPADAPDSEAPSSAVPDGLLVMGVVGRADGSGVVHREQAVVADPRTGSTRARRLPGGTLCHGPVLAVGDRVVFGGYRRGRVAAVSLPLTLTGRPRFLGALPRWASLEGVVDGGFLVAGGRGLARWGHGVARPLRSIRNGWLVAARGSHVASCAGGCRGIRVGSGHGTRLLTPPAGLRPQGGLDGAFSPDGDRLALPVLDRGGVSRVAVVDVASDRWSLVPGGRLHGYGAAMAWSPLGAWLYFTGGEDRILAWASGMARATTVPIDPGGRVLSIQTAG